MELILRSGLSGGAGAPQLAAGAERISPGGDGQEWLGIASREKSRPCRAGLSHSSCLSGALLARHPLHPGRKLTL